MPEQLSTQARKTIGVFCCGGMHWRSTPRVSISESACGSNGSTVRTTTYEYDENDRLTRQVSDGPPLAYAWSGGDGYVVGFSPGPAGCDGFGNELSISSV